MALITTLLWSGSYIVNKIAFQDDVGPLTLSGLRYLLASVILLCLPRKKRKVKVPSLSLHMIIVLGIAGYAIAQGLQYVGQSYLTPTQSSLFLSVGNTTIVVFIDRIWLKEHQSNRDIIKLLLLVLGIMMYYFPFSMGSASFTGMFFMLMSSVGYAVNLTLNRNILKKNQADTITLVAKPMLVGAMILLIAGFCFEGVPIVTGRLLLILIYLSGASGALGFYLWTASQKELTAFQSSSINNLMLIEIAIMDLLFFGRSFTLLQIVGIIIVFTAIISIQHHQAIKD